MHQFISDMSELTWSCVKLAKLSRHSGHVMETLSQVLMQKLWKWCISLQGRVIILSSLV